MNDKDRNYINKISGISTRQIYWLWILPASMLLVFLKEIYIAYQFTEIANLTITEAITQWAGEMHSTDTYSGAVVGAIQRIDRAIYSFLLFFVTLMLTWHTNSHINLLQRLFKNGT